MVGQKENKKSLLIFQLADFSYDLGSLAYNLLGGRADTQFFFNQIS